MGPSESYAKPRGKTEAHGVSHCNCVHLYADGHEESGVAEASDDITAVAQEAQPASRADVGLSRTNSA